MSASDSNLAEFHWLMDVLQTVDVGILVVSLDNRILSWNSFMENHSGISPDEAIERDLFEVFPDLPSDWFAHKARTVVQLKNRAFTTWEQRPYVFHFKNNRPITGKVAFMYQNCTFIPVTNVRGEVESLCIIVYDVTDEAAMTLELRDANEKMQALARLDDLTGLYSRGYWEVQLKQELTRQKRTAEPTSLIMLDIDHFKRINDTHGRKAGDTVLQAVAALIQKTARISDVSCHFSIDKFALMLPNTPANDALVLAERLREEIAELAVAGVAAEPLTVTASMGVSGWTSRFTTPRDWLIDAEQALYQSKADGRDRVTLA
ncbi:diguanylate cyclase [Saccharospirillum mangrovi]|uniref:sensor domain-containing diguanylate cyclase n=1 Tax=Saccharospirillum mangrovi TaxID=2161747 RepID=UPI000D3B6991|nr:diguanylate cyclase [Saccharospirillum mangrovi]